MPPPDAKAGTALAGSSVAASFFGEASIAGSGTLSMAGTVEVGGNPVTIHGKGYVGPDGPDQEVNGDFEVNATGWVTVGAGGSIVSSTDQAFTGTRSGKWQSGTSAFGQMRKAVGAKVPLTPGQPIWVRFRLYRTEALVHIDARLMDEVGGPIGGTSIGVTQYSGEWREFVLRYTPVVGGPTEAGLGLIKANDATDIVVYVDAVETYYGTYIAGTAEMGGAVAIAGTGMVTPTGSVTKSGAVAIAGQGTLSLQAQIDRLGQLSIAGQASLSMVGHMEAGGRAVINGTSSLGLNGTAIMAGRLVVNGSGALAIVAHYEAAGRLVITGLASMEIEGARIRALPPRRILVEVFDVDGELVDAGPFADILEASYTQELDRIGSFSISIPAAHERAGIFQQRREVHIYREGEGLVFKGLVGRIDTDAKSETPVAIVRGSSTARRLVLRSTGRGRSYTNVSLATAAADLLSGTGFTLGAVATLAYNITARMDSASRWVGLEGVAKQGRVHMREDLLSDEIDVDTLGADTGIVLRNVESVSPALATNASVIPLAGVTVAEDSDDLWNRLYPLGAGEGNNALDLGPSDRSIGGGAPYDIETEAGPDGRTQYYIEDAASVAAYGLSEKWVNVKEAIPLSNDAAAFTRAANALYDVSAGYLGVLAWPRKEYGVAVPGLKHLDNDGFYRFQVGDKLRLDYRGMAHRRDGSEVWLDVNELLWLMGYSRTFRQDGSDAWEMKVATIDRQERDVAERIADIQADVRALAVSPKPYNYERGSGPYRDSVDASNPLNFNVKWDDGTFLLHRSLLTFRVRGVRANATGAASGGGTVTSAESGGGGTSSSATDHSHSVSGQSAAGGGSHTHGITGATMGSFASRFSVVQAGFGGDAAGVINNHNHASAATDGANATSPHAHTVSGGTGAANTGLLAQSFVYDINFPAPPDTASASTTHTHSVTATTSGGGGSHSHTVSAHTHSVTVPSHTHSVVYGIHQASTPGAPQVTISINGVSRTAVLGGPWNTGQTVDITPYLTTGTFGQPARQDNTITLGANQLCDIEVEVHSLASSTSIALPV